MFHFIEQRLLSLESQSTDSSHKLGLARRDKYYPGKYCGWINLGRNVEAGVFRRGRTRPSRDVEGG